MTKIVAFVFFLAFGSSVANADIIYSNLNPARPFDTSNGSFIADSGYDLSLSFAFQVTGHDYVATGITFGAFLSSGANAITATIYDDNGGVPGTALFTSAEIAGLLVAEGADNTGDAGLITQMISSGPLLIAGNTYWLSLDASPDSQVTWGNNGGNGTDLIDGSAALVLPGNSAGDWTAAAKTEGAFAIEGTVEVPEPYTTGLVVSGLGALVFIRRKRGFLLD